MPTLHEPRKDRRPSPSERARWLATILAEEFGVPFRVLDASDGSSLLPDDPPPRREDLAWAVEYGVLERSGVLPSPDGGYRLAVSLHDEGRPSLVAFARKPSFAGPQADAIREEARCLERWLRAVCDRLSAPAAGPSLARRRDPPPKPASEGDAWDVILQLEHLMRVQKAHREPERNRRRVLQSAAAILPVESLVLGPARRDEPVVQAGESLLSPWEAGQLAAVLSRSNEWREAGYQIVDVVSAGPWAASFPRVANLLALPILDGNPVGWLIALNKKGGRAPFLRADAATLAPFAGMLGYHARAYRSYSHLRELLIGLTRSLTAAIDAKDSYTYGHSERVARVAVEIGRELGLRDDELSDIYLGGLLHDIGKIGIRDEVLSKPTPLDPEEMEHIKQHVVIGHRILSGLHAISHILPGVLHHHERYDGRGYPSGLRGDDIALVARVLAVADSYDAMSTPRPYRPAMSPERVERVLVEGAGSQWEPAIVEAFLRCKERVCAIRQRGVGDSLCGALDHALRRGTIRHADTSIADHAPA